MAARTRIVIAAAVLAVAGCGDGSEPAGRNQGAAAPVEAAAAPVAEAATPATAPARYTLAGTGLAPGLTFGMGEADVAAAAAAVFGRPTGKEHNDECGEGPMDFVRFGDLQLGFQEGKFVGWSLSGSRPVLHTAGGLAVGAPRSALGPIPVDEASSIGPEFEIGGVGGFLDDQGNVMALWAGSPCQFR